jgi:hypoxanthine phosphoribosyltransferase
MEQKSEPYISQEVSVSISGKSVIVVDEICDTGSTLDFVQKYLQNQAPSLMRTAVLYMKSHSVFTPDFWVQTSDKWIVFPGELRETAQALRGMEGLDQSVYDEFHSYLRGHGADQSHKEKLNLTLS